MTAPNSIEGHKLNAEALEAQGKWDAAEKEYKAILAQNPQSPGSIFVLGDCYSQNPMRARVLVKMQRKNSRRN